MGVFQSEKSFTCDPAMINVIADRIVKDFQADGYECGSLDGDYGIKQISIRKGNSIFKTVLGLKTALNVKISPLGANSILINASIGLFETQALPTTIMLFLFWPVIATQIWGLIQQSRLDDRVMEIADKTIKTAGRY